jgi:putative ABC transport system permease protein
VQTWITLLVREPLRAIYRHKLRSALSAVGIMIGIAAVVLMVATGTAGAARAENELHKLGDNLVWIEAGARAVNGLRTGSRGTTTLTIEDADAIRREVRLIKRVSANIDGSLHVAYVDQSWTTRYRGVDPEYIDIKAWTIARGANFTSDDVKNGANVCLIGRTVREQLFGDADPVGAIIRVENELFEVAGVLAPKGQSTNGQDQDDTIMMPWTTAEKKVRGRGFTWLDDILCSAATARDVDRSIGQIVALLRERHHLAEGEPDDFNIRRPDTVIKAQLATSKTFGFLLFCVASIALLVGGIGIMNVMLASVTERTREIGVRLAVGATRGAVQLQFLAEAVMLSGLGGICGLGLSAAGRVLVAKALGWSITLPLGAFALALGFSVGVGILFGFYPARHAANLDPIVALRHE